MAEFDAEMARQEHIHNAQEYSPEQHIQFLTNELNTIRIQQARSFHPPPNFHISQPPPFSGNSGEIAMFRIKLIQFLMGNDHAYPSDAHRLLFVGGLLTVMRQNGGSHYWIPLLPSFPLPTLSMHS